MQNVNKQLSRDNAKKDNSIVELYSNTILSEDADKFLKDSAEFQKKAVKVVSAGISIPGLSFIYDKWVDLQTKFWLLIRGKARNYIDENKHTDSKDASKKYRDSMRKENFESSNHGISIEDSSKKSKTNLQVDQDKAR